MKPSERIQELLNNDNASHIRGDTAFNMRLLYAITDYLDEEYEKKGKCEHKEIDRNTRFCKQCEELVL